MSEQQNLSKGWEWYDFGIAQRTMEDGTFLLMEHPMLPPSKGHGFDDDTWIASAYASKEAFENGEDPTKRWGLAARRSELASKEAELVYPHVMAYAEVLAQRGAK